MSNIGFRNGYIGSYMAAGHAPAGILSNIWRIFGNLGRILGLAGEGSELTSSHKSLHLGTLCFNVYV